MTGAALRRVAEVIRRQAAATRRVACCGYHRNYERAAWRCYRMVPERGQRSEHEVAEAITELNRLEACFDDLEFPCLAAALEGRGRGLLAGAAEGLVTVNSLKRLSVNAIYALEWLGEAGWVQFNRPRMCWEPTVDHDELVSRVAAVRAALAPSAGRR